MDEILIQTILAIISAVASGFIGYFFYKFKKYEKAFKTENEKQIQEILRRDDAVVGALCSERILQIYVSHKKQNSITKQNMDMAGNLYVAYHKLGGNGTITAVYENILQIPIKEES